MEDTGGRGDRRANLASGPVPTATLSLGGRNRSRGGRSGGWCCVCILCSRFLGEVSGRLGIRRDAVETIECGVGNTEVDREIPAFVYFMSFEH